jgi:hypothetical protein
MSDYQPRPKIKLADVREYKSANGKQYFSFYMANGKFLLFRDEKAEPTGNAIAMWQLLIEQAEPKPQQPAPEQRNSASGQSRPAAGPSRTAARTAQDARAEASLRERNIDPNSQVSEDDLPF